MLPDENLHWLMPTTFLNLNRVYSCRVYWTQCIYIIMSHEAVFLFWYFLSLIGAGTTMYNI